MQGLVEALDAMGREDDVVRRGSLEGQGRGEQGLDSREELHLFPGRGEVNCLFAALRKPPDYGDGGGSCGSSRLREPSHVPIALFLWWAGLVTSWLDRLWTPHSFAISQAWDLGCHSASLAGVRRNRGSGTRGGWVPDGGVRSTV